MQPPACFHVVNTLLAVNPVVAQEVFGQLIHPYPLHAKAGVGSRGDLRHSLLENPPRFDFVGGSARFPQLTAIAVIAQPPDLRSRLLVDTASTPLSFHAFPFSVLRCIRALTAAREALRAMADRCSAVRFLALVWPPLLPNSAICAEVRTFALALPPSRPSICAALTASFLLISIP